MDDWTPEPLVVELPPTSPDANLLASLPVIVGGVGPRVKLASNPGRSVINLTSYNFTGLAENERLRETALTTLRNYGVGSCGPPGFWGTNGSSTTKRTGVVSLCLNPFFPFLLGGFYFIFYFHLVQTFTPLSNET